MLFFKSQCERMLLLRMLYGTECQHVSTIIIIYIFIKNLLLKYPKMLHKNHTQSPEDLIAMGARKTLLISFINPYFM